MTGIQGRIRDCFENYREPGTATVKVTIDRDGRVSQVDVVGQFANTPTGDCVSRAVRVATFAKFRGQPMHITYPFMLR
jgi:hypothetical protein